MAVKVTEGGVERIPKCTIRDGKHIDPCSALNDATEFGNPRGKQKGIFSWQLIDMSKGERSRTFFGVKSGDHVSRGVAFNFCPFCGTQIDAPFEEPPQSTPDTPTSAT